jgi:hypothetical protein
MHWRLKRMKVGSYQEVHSDFIGRNMALITVQGDCPGLRYFEQVARYVGLQEILSLSPSLCVCVCVCVYVCVCCVIFFTVIQYAMSSHFGTVSSRSMVSEAATVTQLGHCQDFQRSLFPTTRDTFSALSYNSSQSLYGRSIPDASTVAPGQDRKRRRGGGIGGTGGG